MENKNTLIEAEPTQLNFSQDKNRANITITNNGLDLVDLELKITGNCGSFKIPYLRGNENICETSKPGTIPLSPQEHQLFYVYYEPTSTPLSNNQAELELIYKDSISGEPNSISIPLIIS
ncbi:hypothetical protein RB653_002822 [Dictyostelium firmibasis]|uniref:Uncharacterized protein n=1 Tax=Dictyostelium firmibasis TaxID=79012 RepID=A0AAN7TRC3_9MYCE